jgi:AcrR family transcriptional regulator
MVPQARSEATRQKILDAAIDLFSQVGYAAAGLGELIERAGMTKGALYHHFDSKDALATAIIEQGTNLTRDAFRHVCQSSSPALENMIHGVFVVTDLLVSDKRPAQPNNSPRTGRIQQRSLPGLEQPAGRDDDPGQPRKRRRRPPRRPRSLRRPPRPPHQLTNLTGRTIARPSTAAQSNCQT